MQTMVLLEEIEGFKKKLKCPICNSAEKDAILTKCFHVFCYHCLKTRYETRIGSFLAKKYFLQKLTIFGLNTPSMMYFCRKCYHDVYPELGHYSKLTQLAIMTV